MKLVFHDKFLKDATQLQSFQKDKLADILELLILDPFHPSLHTKRLVGALAGLLSSRVTRDYRVIFKFLDADNLRLMSVRHRKDAYR